MEYKYFVCEDEDIKDEHDNWDGDQGTFVCYEPTYGDLKKGLCNCFENDEYLMEGVEAQNRGRVAEHLLDMFIDMGVVEAALNYYEPELTDYFKKDALDNLIN